MDYQGDFQDMIARYNRELMNTYRRQQPAAPTKPIEPPLPTKPIEPLPPPEPSNESSSLVVDDRQPPAEEATASVPGEDSLPPPNRPLPTPPPDFDTRPRYPLFDPLLPRLRPVVAEPVVPETATPQETPPEPGFLQVQVTTADEALPVEGAHVTIGSDVEFGRAVQFIGLTDRSGLTTVYSLPAASRQLSMSPGDNPTPYTPYTIEVAAEGFYRVENTGVPVYSGVKAVQPVRLIPLPEFGTEDNLQVFPAGGPTDLAGEEGGTT